MKISNHITSLEKLRTCTMCNTVMETLTERRFSQGNIVCPSCKIITQADDNRAFDRDMAYNTFTT